MARYKFSDIAYNITDKKMPVPEDKDSYVGLEHMDSGSLSINRFGSTVALKGEKLVMKKGDILFGRRNAYLKRAAIAPHDGIFSAHGMVLRPKTEVVNEKFFPFFIASDYFMDTAIQISVGSLSPTVNWGTLKNVEFNLPDLKEQEKLAELLWAANDTKEAYKKLLSLTEDLVKSQFIEMFGDIDRNKNNFLITTLNDVCDLITDGTHQTPVYSESGYIFLSSKNVKTGKIDWDDVKHIPEELHSELYKRLAPRLNDILLAKNGTTGIAAIVDRDCVFDIYVSLALLRPKHNINPVYLHNVINSDDCKRQFNESLKGIGVPNLHLSEIRITKILVPPIELQNQFAEFVKQIDKSKFICSMIASNRNLSRCLEY